MASIFISYAHVDLEKAEAVRAALEAAHCSVSMDPQIPVGARWRDWLKEHLQQASVVVVLWSRQSVEADWVRAEAEVAKHSSVLLPLVIDDLEEVPLGFGETQCLVCKWNVDGTLAKDTQDHLLSAIRTQMHTVDPLQTAMQELRAELESKLGTQYEVLRTLGSGRLSVVFQVRDRELGQHAAIKVTPLTGILLLPGLYEQFRQGVIASQALNHDNVLQIRELRLEKGIACVIMAYVEGMPLSQCIHGTPMELDRVRNIGLQLASALSYAHGKDDAVIHCNLRSSNILIDARDRPFITDFGLAVVRGRMARFGAAKELFWNPAYVSPEQCEGEDATTRSDQYSLGVILYEMLAGVPPFQGKSAYDLMRKHCTEAPIPLSERRKNCPSEVCATVMRLLEKEPSQRFLRTAELLDEIRLWPSYERISIAGQSQKPMNPSVVALRSYERCLQLDSRFIDKLYMQLLRHDELRTHLEDLNFDRQVSALQVGIPRLLALDMSDPQDADYFDKLVRVHRPLGLASKHFEIFRDVLAKLIGETDTRGDRDGIDVEDCFRTAFDATLARMVAATCQDAATRPRAPNTEPALNSEAGNQPTTAVA